MTSTSPTTGTPSRLAAAVRVAAPLALSAYGLVAAGWAVTGRGYPFDVHYPDSDFVLVRWIPHQVAAPGLAVLLLAVAGLLVAISGWQRPGRRARLLVLGLGWGTAAVLAVGMAGITPLALLGYAPMIPVLLLLRFGGMTWHDVLPYTGVNQVACVVLGILTGLAVLGWQWRTSGRCERCGLAPGAVPDRGRWARLGHWTVGVSVVIPLLYAMTRLAWVIDIPLGITRAELDDLHTSHAVWAGFGLGTFAVAGSLLSLGLVQRWGETFPAWTWRLRGRRVPIALAVVPAGLVAVLTVAAGLSALTAGLFLDKLAAGEWAVAPALLWPLWGVALGTATVAYARRRQGPCPHRQR
jgi:hypothetical protein